MEMAAKFYDVLLNKRVEPYECSLHRILEFQPLSLNIDHLIIIYSWKTSFILFHFK